MSISRRVPTDKSASTDEAESEETYCSSHGSHGKEAEELRAGIEKIIDGLNVGESHYHFSYEEMIGEFDRTGEALQELLDQVDARDSLAFVEKRDVIEERDNLEGWKTETLRRLRSMTEPGGSKNPTGTAMALDDFLAEQAGAK